MDMYRERHADVRESRRKYFWLVTADPTNNKPYLIFGGSTEEEARQKGLEMLPGIDFEIYRFPTRHLATASSMLRGQRLDGSRSLNDASRMQGHNKSLRRLLKHKRQRE